MPELPRSQQAPPQTRTREKPRAFERSAPPKPQQQPAGEPARPVSFDVRSTAKTAEATSIRVGEAKATAGRAGESNLAIQWIDVWIGNNKPCRFDVRTSQGNGLEVVVEQLAYKKTYTGITALSTQPVPPAPPGSQLKVIARDTTTGEVLEQPGYWYGTGAGGFLANLWKAIKRLIWKP